MIIIIRTLILYISVITALRLMGKKQIGQLEPSELAVSIMISEIASLPLTSTDTPLINGIIPVFILAASEILLSVLVLKTKKIRKLITGHPTIILKNGVILTDALKKLRYTTDDLIVEMRTNGISDFNDISYAILETNGQVSFILKKGSEPPNAKDLNLKLKEDFLAFPVITKKKINKEYLRIIERNEEWLFKELNRKSLKLNELLILTANHEGIKFYQKEDSK